MFVLGHLGVGATLVQPWSRGLRRRWIFLGTLAPDIFDKPLYYVLSFATGRSGADLGLISGTRTIAHTAIVLLVVASLAAWRRSRVLAAVTIGAATHLFLDNLGDLFAEPKLPGQRTVDVLLFPLLGAQFPDIPFGGPSVHLLSLLHPYTIGGEIAGALLLGWMAWKRAHRRAVSWKVR